jgi:hypothetical protein
MISFGIVLVNGLFESYIAQCELGTEMCILIKIQWLLLIERCWREFFIILFIVPNDYIGVLFISYAF